MPDLLRRPLVVGAWLVLALSIAACGGAAKTPAPTPIPAPSPLPVDPDEPCTWLSGQDFWDVGIEGAGNAVDTPDGTGRHFCVLAGASGLTGGIEYDVSITDSVADATQVYESVVGSIGEGPTPASQEYDQASFLQDAAVAGFVAREGRLVLALIYPSSDTAEADALVLTDMLIERAGSAASE